MEKTEKGIFLYPWDIAYADIHQVDKLMAPHAVSNAQVIEYRKAYEKAGVKKLLFYNYGMAPLPLLKAMV